MNNGLKKILFINSAFFECACVDISNNTLLLGESGVGKTSLMRAVLFFYTMDNSQEALAIDRNTKRSFVDWYFHKGGNSHIAYEYTTKNGRFLFVVSREEHLRYTFIDISNYEDDSMSLLLKDSNSLSFKSLIAHVQEKALTYFSTHSKDVYRKVFHSTEYARLKDKPKVDFSLFKNVNKTLEFGTYLTRIFASSRINDTSIKKILISLINEQETSIDLSYIVEEFNKALKDRKELESLKRKKDLILDTDKIIFDYKDNRSLLKNKIKELEFLIKNIDEIKTFIYDKEAREESNKKLLENDYEINEDKYNDEINDIKVKIALLERDIKELENLDKFYQNKNINILLQENEKFEELSTSFDTSTNEYNLLTNDKKSLKEAYESECKEILKRLNLSKDLESNEIISQKQLLLDKQTLAYAVREEKEETLKVKDNELDELKKNELNKNHEILTLKNQIEILSTKTYSSSQTQELERSIKELEDKKNIVFDKQKLNEDSIEHIEKDIEEENKVYKNDLNKLIEKLENDLEDISKKIQKEELKADFDKNNLYSFLNKTNHENRDLICALTKEEVLFDENEDFEYEETSASDSLYGIKIKINDSKYIDKYDISKVRFAINQLEYEKKKLKTLANEDKETLAFNTSKKVNKLQKSRTSLYSSRSSFKYELDTLIRAVISKETILNNKLEVLKTTRKKELISLNENLLNNNSSFVIIKKQKEELAAFLFDEKLEIKKEYLTFKENNDNAINVLRKQSNELEKTYLLKYENEKSLLEKIFNDNLHKDGIDKNTLEDLNTRIKEIDVILKRILNNKEIVSTYINEDKEKIDSLLKQKEKNSDLSRLRENKKNAFSIWKKQAQKEISQNSDKLKFIQNDKKKMISFINNIESFKEKIDVTNIQHDEPDLLLLNSDEINKIFEENKFVLLSKELEELLNKKDSLKNSIENKVTQITKGFKENNACNLPILEDSISDYGTSIEEYIQIAQSYIDYVSKGLMEQNRSEQIKIIYETISKAEKQLEYFNDSIGEIDKEVKEVNSEIKKAIEKINVIDKIELKFKEDINNLCINELNNLINFTNENSEIFIIVQEKVNDEKDIYDEVYQKIASLSDIFAKNTYKQILKLDDVSTLSFAIKENGNDLGVLKSLSDIGSGGTNVLVRSIIYISLLKKASKHLSKDGDIRCHCILDEIGTISSNYFGELKKFVQASNFNFLNGMPIVDDDIVRMYPTIYTGEKVDDKKTEMINTKEALFSQG